MLFWSAEPSSPCIVSRKVLAVRFKYMTFPTRFKIMTPGCVMAGADACEVNLDPFDLSFFKGPSSFGSNRIGEPISTEECFSMINRL